MRVRRACRVGQRSPVLTWSNVRTAGDGGAINAEVRARVGGGASLFEFVAEGIAELRPDAVLARSLCHVCA